MLQQLQPRYAFTSRNPCCHVKHITISNQNQMTTCASELCIQQIPVQQIRIHVLCHDKYHSVILRTLRFMYCCRIRQFQIIINLLLCITNNNVIGKESHEVLAFAFCIINAFDDTTIPVSDEHLAMFVSKIVNRFKRTRQSMHVFDNSVFLLICGHRLQISLIVTTIISIIVKNSCNLAIINQ